MAATEYERTRRLLRKQLGSVSDRGFLESIWAANALRSDRASRAAALVFGPFFPAAAKTNDPASRYAIHAWELETLANELLASAKEHTPDGHRAYLTNFSHWWSVAWAVNTLRSLEDHEYAEFCDPKNILREMSKIAARQFDWQRGFFNVPQFYRSAFIFGGPLCTTHLNNEYGTSISEMSLVGFAIFSVLLEHPSCARTIDLDIIGADRSCLERVLSRICKPLSELRDLSRIEREGWPQTAYRPSVLRQFPCIAVGARRAAILSPLPELVLQRVTSGIFYDVVGGGGPIRNEYGHRFEEYCWRYIGAQLPDLPLEREQRYTIRKQAFDTPDLLVRTGKEIRIAIECKATKMTARARLSGQSDDQRGFDDVAKGIFQIWRFLSHSRQGRTGFDVSGDTIGMLVTLDGWMVMGGPLRTDVLRRAEEFAAKDRQITTDDKKPIIFCQITDLESTLADADEDSFLRAVQAATTDEFEGWLLSSVHSAVAADPCRLKKRYPFKDLAKILPWWGTLNEMRREKQLPPAQS